MHNCFAKANVFGNDFVLLKTEVAPSEFQIKLLANPKFGIGADQILILNDNAVVNIWNTDGSSAKMCANGLKALAKWIFFNQKYDSAKNFCSEKWQKAIDNNLIRIHTISGIAKFQKTENDEIQMHFPYEAKMEKNESVYIVNSGNKHKIHILQNEPEKLEDYKSSEYNVSCIWKVNDKWYARTWELGTGETFACGSAAFSIASILNELGEKNLNVHFKYGEIKHKKLDKSIVQISDANIIAIGKLFIPVHHCY